MASATTTLSSFPLTISRAWTWGRRLLWTLAVVFAVVVVLEAIHLHGLLETIHPAVAWTVTALLVGLLAWWGGRALLRYLRVPRVIAPPELPPVTAGWDARQQQAYRRFVVRYLERQAGNPHLDAEHRERVRAAVAAIEAPLEGVDREDRVTVARALSERVEAELAAVLEPLDRTAGRLIRRTSVQVAIATAVSPSILLDSLITLAHNLDLISKLADLYYGRPGLFGTLRVARDVFGAAVAAGALEVVSDNVTAVASEMTGSWSTRLLGPLGQGAVNGVVTMRLGAAARGRCRSVASSRIDWRPWRLADYRKAVSRLFDWVSEDVGPRFTRPFSRWMRGADPDDATGPGPENNDAAPGKRSWWSRLFGRAAEPSAEPSTAPDPLLDSDLFDDSRGRGT
jgi:hypothetical protein